MKRQKKDAILGIIIASVVIFSAIAMITNEEHVSHDVVLIPIYIVNEISNQEAQYYGKDLADTYEIVIAGERYKGKLVEAYYSAEYRRDMCDYICEDNTIMHFVCGASGLEFLSIEFGTPVRIFQDDSEEHIKEEIMNYFWDDDKKYVFDVIKESNYINYKYTRYIDNIETLEGINLVMDDTGMVYKISSYILKGNAYEFDLKKMSDSDESLKEYLEKEYGKNVKYEIVKKQISYAGSVDSAINYHVRINGGDEVKKYQVIWGGKAEGEEIGKNCS